MYDMYNKDISDTPLIYSRIRDSDGFMIASVPLRSKNYLCFVQPLFSSRNYSGNGQLSAFGWQILLSEFLYIKVCGRELFPWRNLPNCTTCQYRRLMSKDGHYMLCNNYSIQNMHLETWLEHTEISMRSVRRNMIVI